ncbi:MAG: hypothetical protein IT381_32925 [Deltaproteobacteria bacterium]|nr:hypothetical protein [Deltaproteobacteria bacterium]
MTVSRTNSILVNVHEALADGDIGAEERAIMDAQAGGETHEGAKTARCAVVADLEVIRERIGTARDLLASADARIATLEAACVPGAERLPPARMRSCERARDEALGGAMVIRAEAAAALAREQANVAYVEELIARLETRARTIAESIVSTETLSLSDGSCVTTTASPYFEPRLSGSHACTLDAEQMSDVEARYVRLDRLERERRFWFFTDAEERTVLAELDQAPVVLRHALVARLVDTGLIDRLFSAFNGPEHRELRAYAHLYYYDWD